MIQQQQGQQGGSPTAEQQRIQRNVELIRQHSPNPDADIRRYLSEHEGIGQLPAVASESTSYTGRTPEEAKGEDLKFIGGVPVKYLVGPLIAGGVGGLAAEGLAALGIGSSGLAQVGTGAISSLLGGGAARAALTPGGIKERALTAVDPSAAKWDLLLGGGVPGVMAGVRLGAKSVGAFTEEYATLRAAKEAARQAAQSGMTPENLIQEVTKSMPNRPALLNALGTERSGPIAAQYEAAYAAHPEPITDPELLKIKTATEGRLTKSVRQKIVSDRVALGIPENQLVGEAIPELVSDQEAVDFLHSQGVNTPTDQIPPQTLENVKRLLAQGQSTAKAPTLRYMQGLKEEAGQAAKFTPPDEPLPSGTSKAASRAQFGTLKTALHERFPELQQADEAFALTKVKERALQLGYDSISQPTNEVTDQMAKLVRPNDPPHFQDAATDYFRKGAMAAYEDKLQTGTPPNFESSQTQQNVKAITRDEPTLQMLRDRGWKESVKEAARTPPHGGRTVSEGGLGLYGAVHGRPGYLAALNILRAARNNLAKIEPAAMRQLAPILQNERTAGGIQDLLANAQALKHRQMLRLGGVAGAVPGWLTAQGQEQP